jgi:hypothetical protein
MYIRWFGVALDREMYMYEYTTSIIISENQDLADSCVG